MNPNSLNRLIIWGALTSAIFTYLVILFLGSNSAEEDQSSPLKTVFYLVGLLLFGAGQAIRYLVNHTRDRNGKPKIPDWIWPAYIVALAITEAIAIFGLVLGFQGAPVAEYIPLFILSFIGMLLLFPSQFFKVEKLISDD